MIDLSGTRYRVVEFLAAGGMAEVYLVAESVLPGVERPAVLKRLLPQYRDDPELVAMFFDEARVCARLSHPNIVTLREALRVETECCLVFEHVVGVTLRRALDAGDSARPSPLGDAAALAIAHTLAETLAYVHELRDDFDRSLGFVHRDLNPSNVLLDSAGTVRLIDFGIARGNNRVCETATGTVKGTVGYMAPEQLLTGHSIDARTDVFALGVLLYELLTGVAPFRGGQPLELCDRVLSGRYAPIGEVRGELDRGLVSLVGDCLATAAGSRPESMRCVAESLRAAQQRLGECPSAGALAALVARAAALDAGVGETQRDEPSTLVQRQPHFGDE